MKKKILGILLIGFLTIVITGCGSTNSTNDNSSLRSNQENQKEEPKEELSKTYYGFDLEQMKPNKGGEEYNKDVEVDMAIQGKVTARYYGEKIGRSTSYEEDTVYAGKVFKYCQSISSDGKVYQSVGRFKDPNKANVKEVKSAKDAEKISNTYTWSIKLDGYWYVISIAGDQMNLNQSIGVRIVRLSSYK